jgi:succinoglycan biosynthesis transport protein ExoP
VSELETGFRIGDVIAMIVRRWPVVVGAAIVGLIAGYLVYASAPTTYSATSRVQVLPFDDAFGDSKGAEIDMSTERDLVKSDAVAESIRTKVGLDGENRAILSRITVLTDPEGNSDVMAITFEGETAKETQAGANAAAEGYLDARKAGAKATADRALTSLNEDISAASTAVEEATAAVNAAPSGTAERTQAQARLQAANSNLAQLQAQQTKIRQFDPDAVGVITRKAAIPDPVTSKMALGKAVGVFGLFVLAGLAAAWFLDRRDGLGGGRRRIEAIVPSANIRVMPGAEGGNATPAEIDTAIDRLAVELVAGGTPGNATSVLIIGAGMEPPVALAEELASSLAFAGIPALFVLAGSTDRQLRSAHTVPSFADLVTSGASIAGPAGLPAQAGEQPLSTGPLVTWLRPKGSPEAAGLLRRAVVDSLVTRAGRERFEAVVFVAPSPSRTAAGSALGQWVGRTALVIAADERGQAEAAATALAEADVRVTEVVWT